MARIISLICLLTLLVAAFAVPVPSAAPVERQAAAMQQADASAGCAAQGHHMAGGMACDACLIHCVACLAAGPAPSRLVDGRPGAFPLRSTRMPASARDEVPERPPKTAVL